MKNFKNTSHVIYRNNYHIVFCTKYRQKTLCGEIKETVRDTIKKVSEEFKVEIMEGHVKDNHVHIIISIPPHHAISKVVQHMKGVSSHNIFQQFPEIKKPNCDNHFWAVGYLSATIGSISDNEINEYVSNKDE